MLLADQSCLSNCCQLPFCQTAFCYLKKKRLGSVIDGTLILATQAHWKNMPLTTVFAKLQKSIHLIHGSKTATTFTPFYTSYDYRAAY